MKNQWHVAWLCGVFVVFLFFYYLSIFSKHGQDQGHILFNRLFNLCRVQTDIFLFFNL